MITVIGEALINLVLVPGDNTLRALPGGNALVVATQAAGLGHPTALMARLSGDHFGQSLRRYAAERGVDVSAAPEAAQPTMIAVCGPDGSAADGFPGSLYFHGTASWQWSSEELRYLPATTTVLYIGSLAGLRSAGFRPDPADGGQATQPRRHRLCRPERLPRGRRDSRPGPAADRPADPVGRCGQGEHR